MRSKYRLSEYDGHDAGHIDLHGKVGALTAVHLASDDSLRVLDRDPALCVVDENYQHDDRYRSDEHEQRCPPLEGAVCDVADGADDGVGQTGDDTCKQDHGDTVADTMLGDLLAEPHDEGGAGGEGQNYDDRGPEVALCLSYQKAVVLDEHVEREALEETDGYGGVTGDGGYLLLAFLALVLAHALECGDGDAQELDDDGGIDVGLDGEREDRRAGECAAGHDVEQTENGAAEGVEVAAEILDVDVRNGNRVTYTVKQDDKKSENDLLADLFDPPCVTQSFEHLNHLCLSAGRLYLLFRGFGESSSFNSNVLGNLAVSEELNAVSALGDDACIEESLSVDDCAVLKLLENRNVHRLQRLCKDIVEASLGDTTCQRHLAAFKSDAGTAAAAGLLALVTTACGLAVTGRVASALALIDVGGAGYGRKIIDIHSLALLILLRP